MIIYFWHKILEQYMVTPLRYSKKSFAVLVHIDGSQPQNLDQLIYDWPRCLEYTADQSLLCPTLCSKFCWNSCISCLLLQKQTFEKRPFREWRAAVGFQPTTFWLGSWMSWLTASCWDQNVFYGSGLPCHCRVIVWVKFNKWQIVKNPFYIDVNKENQLGITDWK